MLRTGTAPGGCLATERLARMSDEPENVEIEEGQMTPPDSDVSGDDYVLTEAPEDQQDLTAVDSLPETPLESTVPVDLRNSIHTPLARSTETVQAEADIVETILDTPVGADNARPGAGPSSRTWAEDEDAMLEDPDGTAEEAGVRWVISDKAMMSESELRAYRERVDKTGGK